MDKKILTIVSIIFSLIFILALSAIFININSMTQESNNSIIETRKNLNSFNFSDFDNKDVYGDTVEYVINNRLQTAEGIKLGYAVNNNVSSNGNNTNGADDLWAKYGWCTINYSSSTSFSYGGVSSSILGSANKNYLSSSTYYSITPSNVRYIRPEYRYRARLCKDSRGVVVGIGFQRVE